MPKQTVLRTGKPVPIGTAEAFDNLASAFKREFNLELRVTSGLRTRAEQERLFFARYRKQATGGTGARWYKGVRYVHVTGPVVAVPGTSRHESGRALDIHDTGTTPGVTRFNNARSDWIRKNAARFGFSPNGFGFGEPWHIELKADRDPYKATKPAVKPSKPKPQTVSVVRLEAAYRAGLLRMWINKADVRVLQARVGAAADGCYGEATRNRVAIKQRYYNRQPGYPKLPENGRPTNATLKALGLI